MSNIFDALEQAKKEIHLVDHSPENGAMPENREISVLESQGPDMEQEMITLYQTITAALPDMDHRSVLIIGSRSNEGTSTIARELARTVSLRVGKTVLLIDLDRSRPDLHVYAGLKPEKHIDDVVKTGDSMDKAMCQVEESSLYVMPLFQHTIMTPRTLEATKHDGFWEPLKEKFDLIIVDAPPAMMFPDGPGIVPHVDGVILVVEAEKTRWQVALEVKNKITRQGGNILGIVFNRRNYYIPRWLYKRV